MSGRVVVVNVTDVAQRHTAALISVVSPERAERAARYHFVADRMLSLVAGALITGCVGRAVGPGVALTFTRGPHGKPQCPQLAALGMDFEARSASTSNGRARWHPPTWRHTCTRTS